MIALILVGWVALSLALGLALRGPIQRRWLAQTGIAEWRVVARQLPWRQRWTLYRATMRGRAVSPGLAALAVQRAEMAIAVSERMSVRRWPFRRLWQVLAVLLGAVAVLNLGTTFFDGGPTHWWSVWTNVWVVVCLLLLPFLERPQRRAFARCVDLNRAQLDRDETTRP